MSCSHVFIDSPVCLLCGWQAPARSNVEVKARPPGIVVLGADLSLNHGAVVELTNGALSGWWYYTDKAAAAGASSRGARLGPWPKGMGSQEIALRRLAWVERWIDKTILVPRRPEFVGIEDYALRAEHRAHQIGEVGGTARLLCWFRGVKLRLHDPVSVKMFATHDGTADKVQMEESVSERWGVDYSRLNGPPSGRGVPSRQTSEDLADAHAIAQLVWTEVQLRSGALLMSELHPKEVQVFNRVTKAHPKNLLDRDWIWNPDGKFTPHGRHDLCSSEVCAFGELEKRGLVSDKLRSRVASLCSNVQVPRK